MLRRLARNRVGNRRGAARGATVAAPLVVIAFAACGAETSETAASADGAAEAAAPGAPAADASPPAAVRILEPADGAVLDGPNVRIVLGAENITIAPAGDDRPDTGHHHLFVNVPITAPGEAIPVGEPGVIHLGQAQTEHELTELAPGEYTVIAVIGDLVHRRIDPQAVDTVRFTVR